MSRELTAHQIAVLKSMPRAERSRFWGNGSGRLSISARTACVRKGLVEMRMHGLLWTYDLTDAGRAALNHRDQGEGSHG